MIIPDRVVDHIRQAQGWISFADYMALALYAPDFGYYQKKSATIGRRGDFVTAPELTPLFGQCIAKSIAQVATSFTEPWSILELGAGTGTLAASICQALHAANALPQQYQILDVSASLVTQQKQTLAEMRSLTEFRWLTQLPKQHNGIIIANELLDAMPAERLCWSANGIKRLGVTVDAPSNQLQFATRDIDDGELLQRARALDNTYHLTANGGEYRSEITLQALTLVEQLSALLDNGYLLIFDYGYPAHEYYHPGRDDGTIMAFRQQRSHGEILANPGQQDLSVHIDFSALAQAAYAGGATPQGFTTQAAFLIENGLFDLAAQLEAHQRGVIHQLSSPSEMGELVKVFCAGRNRSMAMPGFTDYNRLLRL